jgi:hypothetical protein
MTPASRVFCLSVSSAVVLPGFGLRDETTADMVVSCHSVVQRLSPDASAWTCAVVTDVLLAALHTVCDISHSIKTNFKNVRCGLRAAMLVSRGFAAKNPLAFKPPQGKTPIRVRFGPC